MLKGVARREFDVIAAWSVDRLGRKPSEPGGVPWRASQKAGQSLPSSAGDKYYYSQAKPYSRCAACSQSSSAQLSKSELRPGWRERRKKA
jgi:hypothetical protein